MPPSLCNRKVKTSELDIVVQKSDLLARLESRKTNIGASIASEGI
jgi:hypothetical protein